MSQPLNERFNITDGIALLYPDDSDVCVCCGLSNWIRDPDLYVHAEIITTNSFIPAKGKLCPLTKSTRTLCVSVCV